MKNINIGWNDYLVSDTSPDLFLEFSFATLIPQMDSKAVFTRSEAALAVTAQKHLSSNK